MPKVEKMPDFIANRLDVKYQTIASFQELINELKENNEETLTIGPSTKVHIVTAFGTITGEIILDQNPEEPTHIMEYYVIDKRNEYLKNKYTPNSKIMNNEEILFITNATLKPFADSKAIHYPSFMIFVDQIVGFSWGS